MGISFNGLHHVGVTVRDIKASLAWYRDMFGVEADFVAEGSGEELSAAVGCPHAHLSFAFLRLGNSSLELLEYHNPEGKDFELRNCDVGAAHIAIEVDDLFASYERLRAKGVAFSGEPVKIGEGPLAGCAFAYFRDPDGVQLELFEVAKA